MDRPPRAVSQTPTHPINSLRFLPYGKQRVAVDMWVYRRLALRDLVGKRRCSPLPRSPVRLAPIRADYM